MESRRCRKGARGPLGSIAGFAIAALVAGSVFAAIALAVDPANVPLPRISVEESEPNDTTADANPIVGGDRIRGSIQPNGDIDTFSFNANAGDRVFAAVMTSGSSSASTDSQLRLFDSTDTLVEFDEDDGTMGTLSSSIAGAEIAASGTYTLQVKHFSATNQLRPYILHFELRGGAPVAEVEPNDSFGTATPLPGGYASGARNPAAGTEQDWYSMQLNAGDTVFLSLDLDPERDLTTFNGRLGFALLGDANNQIVVVDDNSVASAANPLSEAMFTTVKETGTYYAFVDSADAATGGPTATYELSTTVIPAVTPSCRTYPATSPGPIADGGTTTFTIPVTDPAIIDRAAISLDLDHARMADIDAVVRSPAGNENGLFTDIGSTAPGGQQQLDVTFDDAAASPPIFTVLRPTMLQPELNYRLGWFEGEQAQGDWELVLRDDLVNPESGTLNGAELILCERPAPPPQTTLFEAGFETGDDGFTHSGTADEWERGLPSTPGTTTTNPVADLSTCGTGTGCFKTDLDSTYEVSSSQDLLSPPISLVGESGEITARWKQWFQMESATFDRFTVSVEEEGGGNSRNLYRWNGATMTASVGTPAVNVPASAGWAEMNADISEYAGTTIQLRFHVDTDTSINFAGVAIDDVMVTKTTPDPGFPLNVTPAGSGSGYVDSSPVGIDCGLNQPAKTTCSSNFPDGTAVTLTAHPDAGTNFSGFAGGGCGGTGPICVVTLDQARNVAAAFAAADKNLTVSVEGDGQVTGPGINCPGDCSQSYADGTVVNLTATPDSGAVFDAWGDDCALSAGSTCGLTMNADRNAKASFTSVPESCESEAQDLAAAQDELDAALAASKKAKKKVKKAKKKVKKAKSAKKKKKAKKALKKKKKKLKQARQRVTAANEGVAAAQAALDACLGGP